MLGDACELRGNPLSAGRSGEKDHARDGGRDVNKKRDSGDSCVRRASHVCSGARTPFTRRPACRVVTLVEFVSCLQALVALKQKGHPKSVSDWPYGDSTPKSKMQGVGIQRVNELNGDLQQLYEDRRHQKEREQPRRFLMGVTYGLMQKPF